MHTTLAPRKPWLAALMSLVLPGFGQLYNGQINKAIWLFLSLAFLTIPAVAAIALYMPIGALVPAMAASMAATLATALFGIYDAWNNARRQPDYQRRAWQISGMYMLVLVACDGVALPALNSYVRGHLVEAFRVPSTSMTPSVLQGDYFFADKRYNCPGCRTDVARGDVALFAAPNDRTQIYIKRVIGLPGDVVRLHGSEVLVNGVTLTQGESVSRDGRLVTERYADRQWQVLWHAAPAAADHELTVPPGQVFVLGDNRSNSLDSRTFNTVPLQDVVGKAQQIWFSRGSEGIRWARMGKTID